MAETKIAITDEQFQRANVHWAKFYRRRLLSTELLRYLLMNDFDKDDPFVERYFTRLKQRQRGPMTPSEVKKMIQQQEAETGTMEVRSKEMDVLTDITEANADLLDARYRFAFLLQEFLKKNPQVGSVANIGARVDFYSAYLARRFPSVNFHSVDFQSNLKVHNSLLPQSVNWTFVDGYPLESIRSGAVKADMYFCVSCSVLMNNTELNAYLDAMATHAKAIAFCEGWWAKIETINNRIIPPEDVPKERPYCGGAYASYHHNYIAKLEERGFSVELSQIVPQNEAFHYLQIIAKRVG
jgi:hypothetical protein